MSFILLLATLPSGVLFLPNETRCQQSLVQAPAGWLPIAILYSQTESWSFFFMLLLQLPFLTSGAPLIDHKFKLRRDLVVQLIHFLILQMRKLRPGEFKWLTCDHPVSEAGCKSSSFFCLSSQMHFDLPKSLAVAPFPQEMVPALQQFWELY